MFEAVVVLALMIVVLGVVLGLIVVDVLLEASPGMSADFKSTQ